MSRKNIFCELLVLDIAQVGNPTLCKHIFSAQTLTSFLSRQDRDSFMLPGFWSALVLTSVLRQAHRAWLQWPLHPWAATRLLHTSEPLAQTLKQGSLSEVQSRKTLCFSSILINAIVFNSTSTKNPEGNRNKSYLTLHSPNLRTGGYWQKFESC